MTDDKLSNEDGTDNPLDSLIAEIGLGVFPDEIRREIDHLLANGQSLEPDARRRFIEAAARGTRDRALHTRGSLETLLFETRRASGADPATLAAEIGVSPEQIRATERGEVRLDAWAPENIADWAHLLMVGRESVAGALRRSLGTPTGEPAYAEGRELRLTQDQEEFIAHVLRHLDSRTGSASSE